MTTGDQEALRLVGKFIAAINQRDVPQLAELMAEDHRFVDATGAAHVGREKMKLGWGDYFAAFPEYRIDVETTVASDALWQFLGGRAGPSGPIRWRAAPVPGASRLRGRPWSAVGGSQSFKCTATWSRCSGVWDSTAGEWSPLVGKRPGDLRWGPNSGCCRFLGRSDRSGR